MYHTHITSHVVRAYTIPYTHYTIHTLHLHLRLWHTLYHTHTTPYTHLATRRFSGWRLLILILVLILILILILVLILILIGSRAGGYTRLLLHAVNQCF